jgi:uncharacterized protein (TIGR03435 family)
MNQVRVGTEHFMAGAMPVSVLAGAVQNAAGRAVVDRTGLTGRYDIDLEYASTRRTGGSDLVDPGSAAPSIFTALQEQLGLKLESRKEQMYVLVIEHVEMPTPD